MVTSRFLRFDEAGRVQVYVLSATSVEAASRAVTDAGSLVQRTDAEAGIVQALVLPMAVQPIAGSADVRFVRLPDYGLADAGSATTQGDAIMNADGVRDEFGVDGTGVRVGVISDGVAGLGQAQASGDLPSVNTTDCNEAGGDPQTMGAEGTAMLEIVHDLAPGAGLWFGSFATGLEFNAAVECLATHTDVSVDDISFIGAGPYDGSSIISANTSQQLNDDQHPIRAYMTAAGNFVQQHYEEPYQACDNTTFQKFSGTANTVDDGQFGTLCQAPLWVPAGSTVSVILEWDDPAGASCNDYDLYMFVPGLMCCWQGASIRRRVFRTQSKK